MKKIIAIFFMLSLVACSDADLGSIRGLGKSRDVKCYSGGILIYSGTTTGKIENETASDGYYFTDESGNYIEINANCIFTLKK